MTQKQTIIEQFNEKFTIKDQMLECVGEDKEIFKEDDFDCELCQKNLSNQEWGYNQAKEEIRGAIINKFGE